MTPDITQMSETELKALGYDQVKTLEQIQINIRMIEAELARRKQVPSEQTNDTVE